MYSIVYSEVWLFVTHGVLLLLQVQIIEPDVKKAGVKMQLPYGYAVLNDSHNVEWHVKLAADTELELKLVYSVEHPPQDRVDGLPKL